MSQNKRGTLGHKRPFRLSAKQKQRLARARTLLTDRGYEVFDLSIECGRWGGFIAAHPEDRHPVVVRGHWGGAIMLRPFHDPSLLRLDRGAKGILGKDRQFTGALLVGPQVSYRDSRSWGRYVPVGQFEKWMEYFIPPSSGT